MDGNWARVRREINGKGLFVMDRIWDSGFRQVTTSNRAIAGPDDFRDLKIRVPVSPLWTSMFKALGSPASIRNLFRSADPRGRRRAGHHPDRQAV